MGKASFATVQDGSGDNAGARIQLYILRAARTLTKATYEAFKHWDLGDIISVQQVCLFKTKTGELSSKGF